MGVGTECLRPTSFLEMLQVQSGQSGQSGPRQQHHAGEGPPKPHMRNAQAAKARLQEGNSVYDSAESGSLVRLRALTFRRCCCGGVEKHRLGGEALGTRLPKRW